jgi:hypothetical protein
MGPVIGGVVGVLAVGGLVAVYLKKKGGKAGSPTTTTTTGGKSKAFTDPAVRV